MQFDYIELDIHTQIYIYNLVIFVKKKKTS
jgi:hypothetical protein